MAGSGTGFHSLLRRPLTHSRRRAHRKIDLGRGVIHAGYRESCGRSVLRGEFPFEPLLAFRHAGADRRRGHGIVGEPGIVTGEQRPAHPDALERTARLS